MTYETSTTDSAATQTLAKHLAKHLKGGEVIELISDLGGGKTTFVQGLAAGLGYGGAVTSPTFTLSQEYKINPSLKLHHYDLYRLIQSGVVGHELAEDLGDPGIITIIEWPDLVKAELPADRLTIEFAITGDTSRQLTFRSGGPRSVGLVQALRREFPA